MGDTPAPNRGTVPEVRGTMSLYYFYRTPVIKAESRVFDDSLLVTIESPDGGMILFGPHQGLMMMGEYYREPFYIHQTSTIYAQCGDQKGKSGTTSATFYKRPNHWNVVLHTSPGKQYSAEGPLSMIDGIHGTDNWRKGGGREIGMVTRMRIWMQRFNLVRKKRSVLFQSVSCKTPVPGFSCRRR
jgi:hypothetical protein